MIERLRVFDFDGGRLWLERFKRRGELPIYAVVLEVDGEFERLHEGEGRSRAERKWWDARDSLK